jgi:DNA mismatch repair protein MutL
MMSSTNAQIRRQSAPIRRLSGALIDQIAAGEVVERPASVVKELVENALDADSSRIRVDLRNGGLDWIAVSDDGWGMSAEDARLCVERHATSKIAAVDDLARIRTYGFRGEALAAIASVSRLRLRSRQREASEATELQVEAGEIRSQRAVGGPPGTRVEVADLFGAVPARRKFLKTATTEWGHISDWLARAALSLPSIHFDVQRDERTALSWPATDDPLERIAAVISEADAAAFTPVSRETGELTLHGFVSRPERHRSTTAGIYLYVNRRPVRDRVLQHALVEIYRDLLPRGRFPTAVLFLDIPPEQVDVNVHPAKWEVRFADPRAIHELVRHGVRDAVAARRWLAPDGAPSAAARTAESAAATGTAANPSAARARQGRDGGSSGSSGSNDWVFAEGVDPADRATAQLALDSPGLRFEAFRATAQLALDSPGLRSEAFRAPEAEPGAAARVRFADLRLLGQLLSTYLVLETKDQLLLIDQHAAHERVLFERLRAEWLERGVESQGLLTPTTLRVEPVPLAALVECRESVARLGFDFEPFGADTVAIRAVPALLAGRDPGPLVRNLAEELAAAGDAADALRAGSGSLDAADRVFASLACHAARRRGDVLSDPEQHALLDALDAIPWAPCCPHGRPVAVPFELAEIERRFSRR